MTIDLDSIEEVPEVLATLAAARRRPMISHRFPLGDTPEHSHRQTATFRAGLIVPAERRSGWAKAIRILILRAVSPACGGGRSVATAVTMTEQAVLDAARAAGLGTSGRGFPRRQGVALASEDAV
jgi:hypothetical protein